VVSQRENPSDDKVANYGDVIISGRELAAVLGLSETHVFTLRRRGIVQQIRAHKNQYRLGASIQAYVAYKCGQDSAAQADFHKERALKEKANRQLREILVEQTRAQLHRARDVEAIHRAADAAYQ
jgi:biotin operon repressor